jgi:transposase
MTVYLGIDWSENEHEVVWLNELGTIIAHFTMKHKPDELMKVEQVRQELKLQRQECVVALETAHNLVVDFLWGWGYEQVYVIAPSVIKSNRGRFSSSGARDDARDGHLIAEVVRTDRGRLQPWRPDSGLTRQIRAQVSLLGYLTKQKVRGANRLRAVLLRYYPAALQVFGLWSSQISLAFIQRYPTPQAAAELSWEEFVAFAGQHRYGRAKLAACFARLKQPQPQPSPETVQVYQQEASYLAGQLAQLIRTKTEALNQLTGLFEQHPDRAIFASLPGTGPLLAPALLSKFGDDRARFPSPASLQALAGTCPVTDKSGKRRVILFRHACDRHFRQIVQQWARLSLGQSIWANGYWHQVRPRCQSDSHALRCLGNRWLAVAWKLWQTGQVYDQSYHLRQRALRAQPR